MGLVLDSGALIAFERGDRAIAALLEANRRRHEQIETSSGCVAQAWRGGGARQALLARLLEGVDERSLDSDVSRQVGRLCATAGTHDIVDAHVALLALDRDIVVTADADDLKHLLETRRSTARIISC